MIDVGNYLDYTYFKKYYDIIEIDLNKQQALNANPKAIRQVNFTGNLDRDGSTTIFSILKRKKKLICIFHKKLWECCNFILL